MPAPKINFNTPEKYWDDAAVGDECTSPAYEVTAARIDAYAELTGDFTPVHVDEEYARQSHFGQRVAHGLMGLSVADGLKTQSEYRFLPGMSLGWTWDFLLPIYIGDVLRVRFKIGSLRKSKSKPGWGIVVLPSELLNRLGLGYEELSKRNERLVFGANQRTTLLRPARCGGHPRRACADHRQGDERPANPGARHGGGARAPDSRQSETAEFAVSVFRMRHHSQWRRAAVGATQPRHRGGFGVF